jgi:hypothetical protein
LIKNSKLHHQKTYLKNNSRRKIAPWLAHSIIAPPKKGRHGTTVKEIAGKEAE